MEGIQKIVGDLSEILVMMGERDQPKSQQCDQYSFGEFQACDGA